MPSPKRETVTGDAEAGLADTRVETEVAHQLLRVGEPGDVADRPISPVATSLILPHWIGPSLGFGMRRIKDGKETLQAEGDRRHAPAGGSSARPSSGTGNSSAGPRDRAQPSRDSFGSRGSAGARLRLLSSLAGRSGGGTSTGSTRSPVTGATGRSGRSAPLSRVSPISFARAGHWGPLPRRRTGIGRHRRPPHRRPPYLGSEFAVPPPSACGCLRASRGIFRRLAPMHNPGSEWSS